MMRSIPTWNRGVILLAIAAAAYFQTWTDLWPHWKHKDATYTHGTLIALVAAWLVWRARDSLSNIPATAEPRALAILVPLSAAWLLAAAANVFIVHAALWPILAFTVLWAGIGWRAAGRFAFPLAFLYFAIPVWDYLKPPLQAVTSAVVGYLTGIAGIPAAVDGPYVTLPSGTIYIALDCSGAHFLCVALAVGVLAGVMRGDTLRTRITILVVAALLSMIFNWIRVLLIVLAYLNPDLQHRLESVGHLTFGWWVFALDLLVFGLVLRFVPSSAPEDRPTPVLVPQAPSSSRHGFAAALVLSLLLPAATWALPRLDAYPEVAATAPATLPGTVRSRPIDSRWTPNFPGATSEHRVAYAASDGSTIELYRNEYHRQSQGKELISRGASLFDAASFEVRSSHVMQVSGDEGSPLDVNQVELVDSLGNPWLAVYTYVIDGDTIANARKAQFVSALRSLYRRSSSGVLALATPCNLDCSTVSVDLGEMLAHAHEAYRRAERCPNAPLAAGRSSASEICAQEVTTSALGPSAAPK